MGKWMACHIVVALHRAAGGAGISFQGLSIPPTAAGGTLDEYLLASFRARPEPSSGDDDSDADAKFPEKVCMESVVMAGGERSSSSSSSSSSSFSFLVEYKSLKVSKCTNPIPDCTLCQAPPRSL